MPRAITSPDRLFDRTWRPGHPFSPRLSRARRVGMIALLIALSVVIGGYWSITDSERVKTMAADYLSRLVGGRVTIGSANLSIFQGLRLSDVRVYTSERDDDSSLIFKAQSFLIRANAEALLRGKLEARQITAIEPYVRLTEDLDSGRWNHQSLRRPTSLTVRQEGERPPQLPQVILRNAIVEYGQMHSGLRTPRGTVAIEGQLQPALEQDVYLFKLQSRGGESKGVGPSVEGKIVMSSGFVSASLMNFKFGADLEAMLPAQVREWWKEHKLTGGVDVPELTFQPARSEGEEPSFRAVIAPRSVELVVQPHEWLSKEEILRNDAERDIGRALRFARLRRGGVLQNLFPVIDPLPITLQKVTGKFIFTERVMEVENVSGYVESNGIKISGTIYNYATPSKAIARNIRVSSMDTSDIIIPASPRYIDSMPQAVREIYDHLRPQGRCRFWVQLDRPRPDARTEVQGEIDVLSGSFIFDKFPYPIDGATGKLVFGTNPQTQKEQLKITEIRGHGPLGGPNEKARVTITGQISPFGAETGVDVTVEGNDIVSEPMLFAALPKETQQALKLFDAPGKGQFPIFRGGFTCKIIRPQGLRQRWNITTDIRLDEASGMLVAFPYPMSNVSGELTVSEDRVKIAHATMKKDGATLAINGEVSWGDGARRAEAENAAAVRPQGPVVEPATQPAPSLRPELRIVATDVPIDGDLLSALPEDQRQWLSNMGVAGKFDLEGMVRASESGEPGFDFRIKLRDGSILPRGGTPAASSMNGLMRLTPGRVVVETISAKRGDAELSARGTLRWGTGPPQLALNADAKNLALDAALREELPAAARAAWDQVNPQGTVDAALMYSGVIGEAGAGRDDAFELLLTPRKLSATPQAVPYRLDDLAGSVRVAPGKVQLQEITAKHGASNLKLSGVGSSPATTQPMSWDLRIAADAVAVDDEFRKALPKALTDLLNSLKLTGTVGFAFDKLAISFPADSKATTQPEDRPMDLDFSVRLGAKDATLDVGVPLTDVKSGLAQFDGAVRGGKLSAMNGYVELPALTLAGRPVTALKATLIKPPDVDLLRIPKLEARIADGEMAGQFDCTISDDGPSRYAVALVLRNADIKQLTGEAAANVRGRLSASLALEGSFNDIATRRGRGDVSVSGEQMYRIPLLLGLLQITNLALPITTPFNEGAARYSVDGNRVTFETIELRAKDMMMQGSGHLDFGTKQVRLTFVTDNTTWPKLPIIGDLLRGARQELLQIHVKGTLQEPKVSAGAFSTFTTTIDEVFRGNESGDAYKKR